MHQPQGGCYIHSMIVLIKLVDIIPLYYQKLNYLFGITVVLQLYNNYFMYLRGCAIAPPVLYQPLIGCLTQYLN